MNRNRTVIRRRFPPLCRQIINVVPTVESNDGDVPGKSDRGSPASPDSSQRIRVLAGAMTEVRI